MAIEKPIVFFLGNGVKVFFSYISPGTDPSCWELSLENRGHLLTQPQHIPSAILHQTPYPDPESSPEP